jgi:diguanylate cyclase (GGDEF)-like protein
LFALSEPDLVVRQVSANIAHLLGMSPEFAAGRSLEAVLGAGNFRTIKSQIVSGRPLWAYPLRMRVGPRAIEMDCIAHRRGGALIVELELCEDAHSIGPINVGAHLQIPLTRMERASSVVEVARVAVREIRLLSGFHRVMAYRFDETWNGEVIAEAADSPVSYLGLHFPAADIPAPVRRLFLLNPLRVIADAASEAVPIVPETGAGGRALDLTCSLLRAAAPIHLDYLRNMGVQASMTVSILVHDRLWGMIACHHPSPLHVDFSTRSVCGLLGQFLASQIALRMDNAALKARLASHQLIEKYMSDVEAEGILSTTEQFQDPRLLEVFDADGLVSNVDGVLSYRGMAVEQELLLPVIAKLRELGSRKACSSQLDTLDPSAASYADRASGALYIGLSKDPGHYLLLLRQELIETVVWAGNPDKAVGVDPSGVLRPRASFEAWQQTVRGRSRPWTALQMEGAGVLREHILRIRAVRKLAKLQTRVRHMADHDELTGLANRRSLYDKLEEYLKRAEAEDSDFAVLFADLDGFKNFNDTLGHAVGDRILKVVAKRILHQIRSEDTVGRLGGDEFVIILHGPHTVAGLAQAVARILQAIERPLDVEAGALINITASIGFSRYPEDGRTCDTLLDRSDLAMYRVKRGGGGAFDLCRPEDAPVRDRSA